MGKKKPTVIMRGGMSKFYLLYKELHNIKKDGGVGGRGNERTHTDFV